MATVFLKDVDLKNNDASVPGGFKSFDNNNEKLINVANGIIDSDAVNKGQLDTGIDTRLAKQPVQTLSTALDGDYFNGEIVNIQDGTAPTIAKFRVFHFIAIPSWYVADIPNAVYKLNTGDDLSYLLKDALSDSLAVTSAQAAQIATPTNNSGITFFDFEQKLLAISIDHTVEHILTANQAFQVGYYLNNATQALTTNVFETLTWNSIPEIENANPVIEVLTNDEFKIPPGTYFLEITSAFTDVGGGNNNTVDTMRVLSDNLGMIIPRGFDSFYTYGGNPVSIPYTSYTKILFVTAIEDKLKIEVQVSQPNWEIQANNMSFLIRKVK